MIKKNGHSHKNNLIICFKKMTMVGCTKQMLANFLKELH